MGLLFYSEIEELGELSNSEIEEVQLFQTMLKDLTYPSIYTLLFKKVEDYMTNL